MLEEVPKRPNTPEHVELVKTDIRDTGDVVEFDFLFAAPLTYVQIYSQLNNRESAISQTIKKKVKEKGWTQDDDDTKEPVSVMRGVEYGQHPNSWTVRFTRLENFPSSAD